MRAITVRQPWAWAIIHGGKDVENRSRNIAGAYRGPVAIHAAVAGAGISYRQYHQLLSAGMPLPSNDPLPRGAILGVVDLVDVHEWLDDSVCYGHEGDDGEATCSPWGMADHYHLVLASPQPLPEPIPWRGALGLWTLPDDVLGGVS